MLRNISFSFFLQKQWQENTCEKLLSNLVYVHVKHSFGRWIEKRRSESGTLQGISSPKAKYFIPIDFCGTVACFSVSLSSISICEITCTRPWFEGARKHMQCICLTLCPVSTAWKFSICLSVWKCFPGLGKWQKNVTFKWKGTKDKHPCICRHLRF